MQVAAMQVALASASVAAESRLGVAARRLLAWAVAAVVDGK